MRFLKFAVLAALFALPVSSANAGVLNSFLSANSIPDVLTDESIGKVFDLDGSGSVSMGDVLVGMQSYRNTSAYGNLGVNDQLNTLFSFTVTSSVNVGGVGGVVRQTYGATAAASALSLQSLTGNAGLDTDSVAAIFTSHSHAGDFLTDDFATALAFVTSDQLDGTAAIKAGDFIELQTAFGIDANGDGEIQFSELPLPSAAGTPYAAESGGLSYVAVGSDLGVLLPVSAVAFSTGVQTFHDIALSGQLLGPTLLTDSDFETTDKTTLAINQQIPEPATLAIFTMIGLVGMQRRRKNRR